jgi:hypothetical protein
MVGDFDESRWVAQWRAAAPGLRRRIATFDIQADEVDDVLSETAIRLFKARYFHPKLSRFRRVAQATAWRAARDRNRTRDAPDPPRRRSELDEFDLAEPAHAELKEIPDASASEAFEALERHLAVRQVRSRSAADNRRAMDDLVALRDRGGPYDEQERSSRRACLSRRRASRWVRRRATCRARALYLSAMPGRLRTGLCRAPRPERHRQSGEQRRRPPPREEYVAHRQLQRPLPRHGSQRLGGLGGWA